MTEPQIKLADYRPGVAFCSSASDYEMPAAHPTRCDRCGHGIYVRDPIWVRQPYEVYHQACGKVVRKRETW